MNSIHPRTAASICKGFGITAVVVGTLTLAVTALALAVIFAPPFGAAFVSIGIATYTAIGSGAAAAIAIAAAVPLFKKAGYFKNVADVRRSNAKENLQDVGLKICDKNDIILLLKNKRKPFSDDKDYQKAFIKFDSKFPQFKADCLNLVQKMHLDAKLLTEEDATKLVSEIFKPLDKEDLGADEQAFALTTFMEVAADNIKCDLFAEFLFNVLSMKNNGHDRITPLLIMQTGNFLSRYLETDSSSLKSEEEEIIG